MGREAVGDQGRAHAGDLVGRDAGADAAAAHGDAARDLAGRHRAREGDHEVGVVVPRVENGGAEVDDVVARCGQQGAQMLLELKPP